MMLRRTGLFSLLAKAGMLPACLLSSIWSTLAAQPIEIVLEPVHAVVVSAPVDGVIEDVIVDEGDPVAPGDVVVEFERAQEELAVERARQVLRKRQFDFAGVKELFEDKMTSETEMLEKEIEQKVAEIDLADAIEKRDLRVVEAVYNGVVTLRHHEDGEYVERGTPLLEIVDVQRLDARFYVSPAAGINIQVGSPVWVHVPLVEETLRCNVVFVDPLVDPSSGLMRVRARIENPAGKFRAGLRGWVSLEDKEPTRWP